MTFKAIFSYSGKFNPTTRTIVAQDKAAAEAVILGEDSKANIISVYEIEEVVLVAREVVASKVQEVKRFLLQYAFQYGFNTASLKGSDDCAQEIVDRVAGANAGFASTVAGSVVRYRKVSEKQAFIIANAACQFGLAGELVF